MATPVSSSDAQKMYDDDLREPCKYGSACYQKNVKHHTKFKHPPQADINAKIKKRKRNSSDETDEPSSSSHKQETLVNSQDIINDHENIENEPEDDLPASPPDLYANIKQKFLVEMPDDFYVMWEFCKKLSSDKPEDVFKAAGLKLGGPFDVLAGTISKATKLSEYLCHHRYYYDPPEFQTVITGDASTQYHIGYFRDKPDELPAFVGSNEASKGCLIRPLGDNLFAAVNDVIATKLSKLDVSNLRKIQTTLQSCAKDKGFSLKKSTSKMKAREDKTVAKGFHGMGIVVPYDRKTEVGYRPLPETNANLRKIFQQIVNCKTDTERTIKFDALQEIITLVHFANDECDYGMGYELSLALFCFGHPYFHRTIELLMPLAYNLLRRPEFGQILKAHLKNRQKDSAPAIKKK